jgi:hypothetical protein
MQVMDARLAAQLTVRLPHGLARRLAAEARRLGLKRADLARMAIQRLLDERPVPDDTPYDRVKSLLGRVASGVPDLGEHHREHLRRRLVRG